MKNKRHDRIKETSNVDHKTDDDHEAVTRPTHWDRLSKLWNPPERAAFTDFELDREVEVPERRRRAFQVQFDEISATIRRTMLTIVGYSFFCFLVLAQSDRLIFETAEIKVPIADTNVSFFAFILVGPLVLIGLTTYLHVYLERWELFRSNMGFIWSFRRGFGQINPPYLFNIPTLTARTISWIIFYAMPVVVLYWFAWKSLPLANSIIVVWLATIGAVMTTWAAIRRSRYELRRYLNPMLWLLVFVAVSILVLSIVSPKNSIFFRAINLTEANLAGRNLAGFRLWGADLSHANLRGANLGNAHLDEATLFGADLSDTSLWGASLVGADLHSAILNGANLIGADLSHARLQGADLRNATLDAMKLTCASFSAPQIVPGSMAAAVIAAGREAPTGTDLGGVWFFQADLSNADLVRVNLSGARFFGTNLSGALLRQANLSGAHLGGGRFPKVDFYGADFDEAIMHGAILQGANLRAAKNLTCPQLVVAHEWQSAYRDPDLGCGAPIPEVPYEPESQPKGQFQNFARSEKCLTRD